MLENDHALKITLITEQFRKWYLVFNFSHQLFRLGQLCNDVIRSFRLLLDRQQVRLHLVLELRNLGVILAYQVRLFLQNIFLLVQNLVLVFDDLLFRP